MSDQNSSIVETVDRYVTAFSAGDRDAWLACFAPDATMEDPVGTPVKHGHDEIGAVFDQSRSSADHVELSLGAAPIVCGNQAAFPLQIRVTLGDTKMGMGAIDVMTFDDSGHITAQRAFVDFSQLAPLD